MIQDTTNPKETLVKIHTAPGGVQFWYDRQTRCWWAARFDEDGNQIGQAVHAYTRQEIEQAAQDLIPKSEGAPQ